MSDSSDSNDTPYSAPSDGPESVTKLYQIHCPDCMQHERWSRFKDEISEEEHLNRTTACDPIIHRQIARRGKWETKSFTIHSSLMRNCIRAALDKYQDFDPDLEDWTFQPPYNPLVHRWDRLIKLSESENNDDASIEASQQLIAFLRPILADSVKALNRTKGTGRIVYHDIWQIFPPNELVVTTFFGVEAICLVDRYKQVFPNFGPPYWEIDLEYIDWNGERCGFATTSVDIGQFKGMRNVNSLPVYPLSFHESAAELKGRLTERGRLFEELRGYHFRACKGSKVVIDTGDERLVSGRVIIDAYAYYYSTKVVRPELLPLESDEEFGRSNRIANDSGHNDEDSDSTDENLHRVASRRAPNPKGRAPRKHNATVWGQLPPPPGLPPVPRSRPRSRDSATDGPAMAVKKSEAKLLERCEVLDPLTDDQCLLATPWVIGLDLKTKEWARFRVDNLSPVVWNDDAFEKLILPGSEKELAWTFVENKALAGDTFDDFVEDKGRGIIILMFGPPGVGKTFTAEAVAERARVPLYNVSAATLGTQPAQVETALDVALDLCKLWKAMLLLDEADVFLSARSNTDLTRNELVAVFLTKLEYYQGICFMTTNRMASLDHAIRSRVDLFLRYADLSVSARRKVWLNFLSKAGRDRFSIGDADVDKLAEFHLNGREIKNLVKTAHLLGVKNPSEKISMGNLIMLVENRLRALEDLGE